MQDSQKGSEQAHHEIIIVKRIASDHNDEHHGGVWKIAFADFMTAMMAFFLVMWLINASDEKTKKAVASYFNPVKLMDTTSNPKGIRDPKFGVDGSQDSVEEPIPESVSVSKWVTPGKPNPDARAFEQALFDDPLSLLAEIAAGAQGVGKSDPAATSEKGLEKLTAINPIRVRDPFDPRTWLPTSPSDTSLDQFDTMDGSNPEAQSKSLKFDGVELGSSESLLDDPDPSVVFENQLQKKTVAVPKSQSGSDQFPSKLLAEKKATLLAEELDKLNQEVGDDFSIEFNKVGDEYQIVLLDETENGMFAIGSAMPRSELVSVMEKIGEQLASTGVRAVISGHTDARQYEVHSYDNWRLSSDRAHMAYYMLVRGGLSKSQVERIEGHADASLKNPNDPLAAQNRRIEIVFHVKQ